MRTRPRKGLQDIATRSSLTGDAANPQRKYLRAASLELRKSLCKKVREAAQTRTEEMDRKIVELDSETARILAVGEVLPSAAPLAAATGPVRGAPPDPARRGLTLKY